MWRFKEYAFSVLDLVLWALDDLVIWWRVGRWYAKEQRVKDRWCQLRGHIRDGSHFNPIFCTRCDRSVFLNQPVPLDYDRHYQALYKAKAAAWHNLVNQNLIELPNARTNT